MADFIINSAISGSNRPSDVLVERYEAQARSRKMADFTAKIGHSILLPDCSGFRHTLHKSRQRIPGEPRTGSRENPTNPSSPLTHRT